MFFQKNHQEGLQKSQLKIQFQTSIMGSHIWNITTFANNTRTILILLVPLHQIALYLPLFFFIGRLVSTYISTNVKVRQDCYLKTILRLFFKRILVTPMLLSRQPRVKSNVTLSFSRKRYKTRFFILNISNLFSKTLIKRKLQKNPTLFSSSTKVQGY